ncbi:MAG: sodium-dependent transporter [Phycisphaerales bacterium]
MIQRAQWSSRLAFVLAAAGSAIGLGNIWKFPYITGENGGGWFVLIYLACILLIGIPIMMAEVFLGRETQKSPVGAYAAASGKPRTPWMLAGWLGVLTAFVVLSYYSVIAGWSLHYIYISITDGFTGQTPDEIAATFGGVATSVPISVFWHVIFMAITIGIVAMGVKGGIEAAAKILMPLLFLILVILLIYATTQSGFSEAFDFIFMPDSSKLKAAGVLEALGHSFFTLSLGMGAMITYGSYMNRKDDLVKASVLVSVLDTAVALMACLILFPLLFSVNLDAAAGPGLVFQGMPIAFSSMTGGAILAPLFFLLLAFAALTSAISLLEVASTYFIDEKNWSRPVAALLIGGAITLIGIPSALSNSTDLFGAKVQNATHGVLETFGKEGMNWLDLLDYIASNWLLPIGALLVALFVSWRVGGAARERGIKEGSTWGGIYVVWLLLLRFIVPLAIIAVFLHASGILQEIVPQLYPAQATP